MGKMIFSLGFWMTIVLFIALGYALGYVVDESGLGPSYAANLNESYRSLERDRRADKGDVRNLCAPQAASRDDDLRFRQTANLQAADRTYAPGLSFSITHHPRRISVCSGPIETPPLY